MGLFLAGVLLCGMPATVFGLGEHGRQAGAELLVLQGDLRLLQQEGLPDSRHRGLRARIRGMLAVLPLLLRMADQERGRRPAPLSTRELDDLLDQGGPERLQRRLRELSRRYPFPATGILPATPSPRRLALARRLHRSYCAGCHSGAAGDGERPAPDLFRQARSLPEREFTARMVTGIRGDALTGIGNPFTDEELAALIAFYRDSSPD